VQVIDGRVNEIGVTLASLPPPASRPVTEPGAYLSASILPALPLPEKREEPPR
jgi:hypothetical protein